MHRWARDLWFYPRRLTGDGVRDTLQCWRKLIRNLEMHKVSSGSHAFAWTVPDEWNLREA